MAPLAFRAKVSIEAVVDRSLLQPRQRGGQEAWLGHGAWDSSFKDAQPGNLLDIFPLCPLSKAMYINSL